MGNIIESSQCQLNGVSSISKCSNYWEGTDRSLIKSYPYCEATIIFDTKKNKMTPE